MYKQYMGGGSVMQRPLFKQMGGSMEAAPSPMPMPDGPPMPMPMPMPMGNEVVAPEAMLQDVAMDGAQLGEEYMAQVDEGIDAAQDPKGLIDAFRGNEAPLEARYQELASFVGEEDAMRTPESVLTMVQPTIMMTEQGALDSGIGELMMGLVGDTDMSEDAPMSQGIGELMTMGAGNTPPVNFNQGGPVMVRKFQTGTPPGGPKAQEPVALDLGTSLMPYYEEAQGIRRGILGAPQERAAQLEEQKRLTQAQMLFDIAQAGLQFAGSTDGRSVAERLANSLAESQLAPRIGERAARFQQMKDVQKQQEQQMDLSALESAERQLAGAQGRAFEMNKLAQENLNRINLTNIEIKARQGAATSEAQLRRELQNEKLNIEEKLANLKITATAAENSKDRQAQVLAANRLASAQKELATLNAQLDLSNELEVLGAKNKYELAKIENAQDFEFAVINKKAAIDRVAAQSERNFQAAQNSLSRIATQFENQKDRDFRSEEALLRREFDEKIKNLDLSEAEKDRALKHADMMITKAFEEHRLLQGDERLTLDKLKIYFDQDYKNKKLALEKQESELKASTSGLMKFTIKGPDGKITQTIAAIGSPEGQALQEQVNEANLREEGSAEAKKVGTESVNPQAYITNQGKIITSYDNNTFVETDAQGNPVMKLLKDVEAKSLGNSDVYSTIKKQKIINYGKERLGEATSYLDTKVYVHTVVGADGNPEVVPLPDEDQKALRKLEKETIQNLYGDITEEDARKGTGFFSNLFALANNIGGTIAPEFFSETFKDTEEARLALERFNLIAVSALTVNPRLAVYDIQRVERILPKATNVFTNPKTEAEKFKKLVNMMQQQRQRLLQSLADEDPAALENIGSTMAKIRELDGVLAMVRITDSASSKSMAEALAQTESEYE
tara:strand:- start:4752 stop:7460 length:2709 start_codon:yes stop_codon:yes gene_type:complete